MNTNILPTSYICYTPTSSNSTIHIIKTPATNIFLCNFKREYGSLKKIRNVPGAYGINGAFFDLGGSNSISNIAIQDGSPVGSVENYDGYLNATGKCAIGCNKGSLVYHEGVAQLSDITKITYGDNSWLQGGIGLHLGNSTWLTTSNTEHNKGAEFYTDSDVRSAMIADVYTGYVYLIVSDAAETVADFRNSIQNYFNLSDTSPENHNRYKGILLDGGKSSQMIMKDSANNTVDAPSTLINSMLVRAVPQVILLKSVT